jgi:hypothetical protein
MVPTPVVAESHFSFGCRPSNHRLLDKAAKDKPTAAGVASVKPEGELLQSGAHRASSRGRDRPTRKAWVEIRSRGIGNMPQSHAPNSLSRLDLDRYHDEGRAGPAPALPSTRDSTTDGLVALARSRQPFSRAPPHRYAVSLEHRPHRSGAGALRPRQGFSREAVRGGRQMPGGFTPGRTWCPRLLV